MDPLLTFLRVPISLAASGPRMSLSAAETILFLIVVAAALMCLFKPKR